ncbi:hypothetical protein [Mesorhizobium ventifaucium]|uniref:hypothetical protein n=1 Tax=Mesorhizobium ventifaucium TaxID=666020 RepID=UPI0020A790D9|nr:hypothetical protein [Mesorhizobium ventifaucium]
MIFAVAASGQNNTAATQIVNSSELVSLPKAKPLMVATASFSDTPVIVLGLHIELAQNEAI